MGIAGVIAAHVGQGLGVAEAHQGVDVGIGVVAGQLAVLQPQHPLGAQLLDQGGFDGGAVQVGIALRRQQTGAGGEQGAGPIGFDAAPLQHHRHLLPAGWAKHPRCPGRCGGLVIATGLVFAAPAVEAEVEQHRPLAVWGVPRTGSCLQHRDWPVVAGPGVLGGAVDQPQPIGEPFACELLLEWRQGGAGFSGVVGEQQHRGMASNGRAEALVAGAHRIQVGRPIAIRPRPGHQHGPLGFPFRG